MIRWASCGLVVVLTALVGIAQPADVIREVSDLRAIQLRPNPFGGAPIQIAIQNAPQQAAQPAALVRAAPPPVPGGLPVPSGAGDPPVGPRPLRPVFTLPGAPKVDRHGDPLPAGAIARFGTVRLRHGTDIKLRMGFTHVDGKILCTLSSSEDSA